jgi:ABC-2 type transport system ATP-binding protein
MQRRLALAATLAHDPDVIFLDEPTAGIDPVLRRKLWDYFGALKDRGRTLFVTTQYVGEAAYCDLVGVMSAGRLLMVETPDGLRRRAFGGEIVDVQARQPLDYRTLAELRHLPFVTGPMRAVNDTSVRLIVDDAGTAVPALVEWANSNNLELRSADKFEPPLDDVFVELVGRERADA